MANRPRERKLTPKQEEVLAYYARGFETREIAEKLGISPHTVRTHRQRIIETYHTTMCGACAIWASMETERFMRQLGWQLPPDPR
jgi:DNA-binding NarL/FixJ family response regulator